MAKKHDNQIVTARLNKTYGPTGEDSSLDPVLAKIQLRTLRETVEAYVSATNPKGDRTI